MVDRKRARNLTCAIARIVIDHNDLESNSGLTDERFQAAAKTRLFVSRRNDDGNGGHGIKCQAIVHL
jgi:hypothetical protein